MEFQYAILKCSVFNSAFRTTVNGTQSWLVKTFDFSKYYCIRFWIKSFLIDFFFFKNHNLHKQTINNSASRHEEHVTYIGYTTWMTWNTANCPKSVSCATVVYQLRHFGHVLNHFSEQKSSSHTHSGFDGRRGPQSHICVPHSTFRIFNREARYSWISPSLQGRHHWQKSYAIGTEVWKEFFQVNTSDAAPHVESYFLSRVCKKDRQPSDLRRYTGVWSLLFVYEALALLAEPGSVLQRSSSLSVSVCGSANHADFRASNPQNFQRFSNVAPTPLNSCLNMLGSRTINLSSSLAEIWRKTWGKQSDVLNI